MSSLENSFLYILPTLILLAGLVSDLLYRKYHNSHFITALIITTAATLLMYGGTGLLTGLAGLSIALAIGIPLVLAGIMGAGDMKLLMVFGVATSYSITLQVILMAFAWGAILGLARTLIAGEAKSLVTNMMNLAIYRVKPSNEQLHLIPFTVPIFMGWVSYLILQNHGGMPWL